MTLFKVGGQEVDLDDLRDNTDLNVLYGEDKIQCLTPNRHKGGRDSTPSMQIYPHNAYCFGCGTNLDAYQFVMKMENVTFYDAVLYLLEHEGEVAQAKVSRPLNEALAFAMNEALHKNNSIYEYLIGEERGLTPEIIDAVTLGSNDNGISIPYWTLNGLENIKTRVLESKRVYYLPDGTEKKRAKYLGLSRPYTTLYPWRYYNESELSKLPYVFITEGEFDALILLQEGVPALSLNSGVTTDMFQFLDFFKTKAYVAILFDMDDAGNSACHSLTHKKNKEGKLFEELLSPTKLTRISWPIEWGKDVTEARAKLVPMLRRGM